jgi:hypothetical protein
MMSTMLGNVQLLGLGDVVPIVPGEGVPVQQPVMVPVSPILSTAYRLLLVAAVSGYHGYKRNNSIGWGIAWFALGGIFPVITPTIAFAQGFGKRH